MCWHARNDILGDFAQLEALGEIYQNYHYFGESLAGKEIPEYDEANSVYRTVPELNEEVPDFVNVCAFPTCSRENYDQYFSEILKGQVREFNCTVDGESYVTFVPIASYDLIDYDRSKYRTFPDGYMYAFTKCVLVEVPHGLPNIFRASEPQSGRSNYFVNDVFKDAYDAAGFTGLTFSKASPET